MNPVLITAGALTGAAAAMTWAVRAPSSTLLAPSFHRGVRNRPAVALTFDDGPSESTPRLLELLAHHDVRATFFQCGANVHRLPSIAREVGAAGHLFGNHTNSHARLSLHSAEFIFAEMEEAQKAIGDVTGCEPRYFRPPYGVRWFGMDRAQRNLALTGVMWSAIGRDWKLDSGAVFRRLAKRASNGGILCLHDGRELQAGPDISVTVEAVRRLVPTLLEQGYELETVTRLCQTNWFKESSK